VDVIPIERPLPRRLQQSTIGGAIVLLAGVVAVVGSHRTVAVPMEPGTHFDFALEDALWGLTRSLGDQNGDVQVVRFLAIVLVAIGFFILWNGSRRRATPVAVFAAGVLLIFISVRWWRLIHQYPVFQSPFGYPMGYKTGDAVYVVGAAGVIAIVGAVVLWSSPTHVPVPQRVYPGGAVL